MSYALSYCDYDRLQPCFHLMTLVLPALKQISVVLFVFDFMFSFNDTGFACFETNLCSVICIRYQWGGGGAIWLKVHLFESNC